MSSFIIVVNNPKNWPINLPNVPVVSAKEYLTDKKYYSSRRLKVLNLCRSYRYQSIGYYVSLLAEARGHKAIPSVATMQDFKSQSIIKSLSFDLNGLIQKTLEPLKTDKFTLSIYFARNTAKRYDKLCRQLYNLFPAPLLRAQFVKIKGEWELQNISPIPASEIPQEHREVIIGFIREYFDKDTDRRPVKKHGRYDLAILLDSKDVTPPSDDDAIKLFEKAAANVQISTERIGRDDYGRLAEFDALFIRTTTSVDNYTYRFSRKAQAEGLVVVDDPISILRCTNKVFLAELLEKNGIPTPKTIVLHRGNYSEAVKELGLPCIIKKPDSSFSQGVIKVSTAEEYKTTIEALLEDSDLIIGQQFMPTDYDWRIGIIDRQPLYACRYYMAQGHWQIYNHSVSGLDKMGRAAAFPIQQVPDSILSAALKSANLIGDGLYGVDLKEINGKAYVIEVNDNPSLESEIEDGVLGDFLYESIIRHFLTRLEKRHN
jgi:glutathione synthase/RimK-type ligase-like ATP-grasp enzyme